MSFSLAARGPYRRSYRHLVMAWLLVAILPGSLFAENTSLDFLNRMLGNAGAQTQASIERLSSGRYRLVDNPASYVIYDKMAAAVRGINRQIANQADMVSYYTVEEAALGSVTAILQDIRLLVIQRSSGILSDDDRDIFDSQIGQLAEEVLRIFKDSEFNTKKILSDFLADPVVANTMSDPGRFNLASLDRLLAFITSQRTYIGAQVNRLQFAMAGDATASLNTQAAASQGDTEYGSETANFARNRILMMANLLMLQL